MQERLALARTTRSVAWTAMRGNLPEVPTNSVPAFDLSRIFLRNPATHVVSAIPLEPAARVFLVNPAFAPPLCERLARIHCEEIYVCVALPLAGQTFGKLRLRKPRLWKFFRTVAHIHAAEDADGEHFGWR